MLSQGIEQLGPYSELDENGLEEFSAKDYRDLLQVYLDVMPTTVSVLEQAYADENAALAAATLHKLKSNTSYICASDLSNCCGVLEKRLRSESVDQLRQELQKVVARCLLLLNEIRAYLNN